MAKKFETYVDTSAFISFLDRSDSYNVLFTHLFADPPNLLTTTLVINECHGWFLKRYDQQKAIQFLNFIEDLSILKILLVDQTDIKEAAKIIKKHLDQPLTITDALGLCVMTQTKIKSCWSTDRHLGLTGVPLIIHQR